MYQLPDLEPDLKSDLKLNLESDLESNLELNLESDLEREQQKAAKKRKIRGCAISNMGTPLTFHGVFFTIEGRRTRCSVSVLRGQFIRANSAETPP